MFYIRNESTEEYEVAAPPEGAMVDDLPSDSAEIKIDGQPYIEYDGAIYKAGNY